MLLKVDKGLWVEIPNDSTEEFKNAKIKKYIKLKAKQAEDLKKHSYIFKSNAKTHNIGVLYNKRVNLNEIIHNCR